MNRLEDLVMLETENLVTLRPAIASDQNFLRDLYATTRADLDAVPWQQSQKDAFINMQFQAQSQNYSLAYPEAVNRIIVFADESIGRILTFENEDEVLLVDIALLPAHRNKGVGTHLIEELLTNAGDKRVRLHVVIGNPARSLYERFGFKEIASDGLYCEMIRNPTRDLHSV